MVSISLASETPAMPPELQRLLNRSKAKRTGKMIDLQTKNIRILLSLYLCSGIKGKKCFTFADLQRQPVDELKNKVSGYSQTKIHNKNKFKIETAI